MAGLTGGLSEFFLPSGIDDYKLWEDCKVYGIESIDSVNIIGLHHCDDLQVEHTTACDGVTCTNFISPVTVCAGAGRMCIPGRSSRSKITCKVSADEEANATRFGLVINE